MTPTSSAELTFATDTWPSILRTRPSSLVQVPERLKPVAVLLEPTSVAEKAITQAYEIQRRLRVWRPRRAAVLGSGTLGLLTALFLRLRGLEAVALALRQPPFLNSELLEEIGVHYISTKDKSLKQASEEFGPFDFIFERTGFSHWCLRPWRRWARTGCWLWSV